MKTHQVYVGMGGNIGPTAAILTQSLAEIRAISEIKGLRCSNFYRTTPVGAVPQDDYINAVCTFETTLPPVDLFKRLCEIEKKLGKKPKPKDYPRVIDLDLLLYGIEVVNEAHLEVPHPKWEERLFVLVPMKELADHLSYRDKEGKEVQLDLELAIKHFNNINDETLEIIQPEGNSCAACL